MSYHYRKFRSANIIILNRGCRLCWNHESRFIADAIRNDGSYSHTSYFCCEYHYWLQNLELEFKMEMP